MGNSGYLQRSCLFVRHEAPGCLTLLQQDEFVLLANMPKGLHAKWRASLGIVISNVYIFLLDAVLLGNFADGSLCLPGSCRIRSLTTSYFAVFPVHKPT